MGVYLQFEPSQEKSEVPQYTEGRDDQFGRSEEKGPQPPQYTGGDEDQVRTTQYLVDSMLNSSHFYCNWLFFTCGMKKNISMEN